MAAFQRSVRQPAPMNHRDIIHKLLSSCDPESGYSTRASQKNRPTETQDIEGGRNIPSQTLRQDVALGNKFPIYYCTSFNGVCYFI